VLQSSFGQSDDFFDIDMMNLIVTRYQRTTLQTTLAFPFFKAPDHIASQLYSFRSNATPV